MQKAIFIITPLMPLKKIHLNSFFLDLSKKIYKKLLAASKKQLIMEASMHNIILGHYIYQEKQ